MHDPDTNLRLVTKIYGITDTHRKFYKMLRREQGLNPRQAHWAFVGACFPIGWNAYDFGRLWMQGPLLREELAKETHQ